MPNKKYSYKTVIKHRSKVSKNASSKKKSFQQSSMEYLMSYGWAIIIIAAILGVLYYTNAFNLVVPSSCVGNQGFLCTNPQLFASDALLVKIGQESSIPITITGLSCSSNQSISTIIPTLNIPLLPGNEQYLIFHCPISGTSLGTQFSGYLWIRYNTQTYNNQIAQIGHLTSSVTNGNVMIYGSDILSPSYSSGQVLIVNTVSRNVTSSITGFYGPTDVFIAPNQTAFYVTNSYNNSISELNIISYKTIKTISGFSDPYGITASPNNPVLYIANIGNNTISIFNLTSNSITKTISIPNPISVFISPYNDQLFVLNGGTSDEISIIDTSTYTVVKTITGFNNPRRMAILPSGNAAYISNLGNNTVSIINPVTATINGTISGFYGPTGVSVSPDGAYLYVSNFGNDTISIVNTKNNKIVGTITGLIGAPAGSAMFIPTLPN